MTQLEKDKMIADLMKLKGSSKKKTTMADFRRVREEVSAELLKEYELKQLHKANIIKP